MSEEQDPNGVVTPSMPPVVYSVTDAALAELEEKYKSPDASTPEGYALCKAGAKELTALRTGLETERKRLKKPALDYGQKLDAKAKEIEARIRKIEGPVKAAKEKVDEIERKKALEAAQAETARKEAIQVKIDSMSPDINPSKTSEDYTLAMSWLQQATIVEEIYEEFTEEALQARDAALHKLRVACDAAKAQEDADAARAEEDARLAAERAELDRKAKEIEEREAAAKAEEDRLAQEKADAEAAAQKVIDDEAARVAAEKARIKAEEDAEAERVAKAEEAERARIAEEEEAKRQEALKPDKQKILEYADRIEFSLTQPEIGDEQCAEICRYAKGELTIIASEIRDQVGKL